MLCRHPLTNESNRNLNVQSENLFGGFSYSHNELAMASNSIFGGLVHKHGDSEASTTSQESSISSDDYSDSDFEDYDDIYGGADSDEEFSAARGFACRSGLHLMDNSFVDKTTEDHLQMASSKREDMTEVMTFLTKNPLLWAQFKSLLRESNHSNGIANVQVVLQEFIIEHPEVRESLHAEKMRKNSQQVRPRGIMETLGDTASLARRISMDVSKTVTGRFSLPSRRRTEFPRDSKPRDALQNFGIFSDSSSRRLVNESREDESESRQPSCKRLKKLSEDDESK